MPCVPRDDSIDVFDRYLLTQIQAGQSSEVRLPFDNTLPSTYQFASILKMAIKNVIQLLLVAMSASLGSSSNIPSVLQPTPPMGK